jgi:hypothetical protein
MKINNKNNKIFKSLSLLKKILILIKINLKNISFINKIKDF